MRRVVAGCMFVFLAVISGCSLGSKAVIVTINSPTGAQALDIGQSFTFSVTVSNDQMNKGATFKLSGVGSLSNVTATGATYAATTAGTATVMISSVTDPTKTQSVNIVVTAVPSITNASSTLAAAVEGTAYGASVTEAGGAGTLTYSVTVGNLPAGLTLNSSTGAITGTAAGPSGTASFTIQLKDSSTVTAQTSSKAFSITVNLPPAPVITPAVLPAGVEGTAYSQTIAVTGGLAPFTYSISTGALPAGLNISSSTGAITGTPTGPNGTANFTIKVVDSSNPTQTATQTFSILINLPAAPTISTTSLSADVEGTAYNQTVYATGYGALAYSVSAGNLPAGLTLNSSTGAITGTPTGPNGTASFTVKVTDGSNPVQSATKPLSIAINLPPAPVITTTSLPSAVEFASYNQTVAATGYAPLVYSISAGALPTGLNINTSTGAITGSPTGPNGTANFTVQVADHSNPVQTITQPLSVAVSLPPAPSITTTSLPNATVGGAYSQTIALTGGHGPFAWSISAGALPVPMTLNPGTGMISGTPPSTSVGTASFTVKVVDASNPPQSATQPLSISVVTGPLTVTPATLSTGAVGDVYPSTNLAASGGVPPYTWSLFSASSTFPAGLSLSAAGQISGTPTSATGSPFNFTVQVKDSTSATSTGNFSITVNPVLTVTTSSLPSGTQGTAYPSTNLNASGGVTPYSWSITSGSLPSGMSFSGNVISGTPTVSGTFPLTFKVTDAAGGTASSTGLSIVLAAAPPLMVTTTSGSLPSGTLNTAYPSTNLTASGGIQPYTWSLVTPGTGPLPPGMSLNSAGQISGTPTSSGTFPFTVQVTDSISGTAQGNLSINVSATTTTCDTALTGKESLLVGDYAFVQTGRDSAGNPVFVGGVFTASGTAGTGNLTAGTLDMNLNTGVTSGLSLTSASRYNLGQDTTNGLRGCMTFVTSAGTQHFAFSVDGVGAVTAGVASNGHIIDFDTTGPYTAGILRQATSSAFTTGSITGNWAFGVAGTQPVASGGGKFSAAGALTFSAGSVSGVGDSNNKGSIDGSLTAFPASAGITFSSGPYSIASNGRGSMAFTPSGSASAVNSFLYVVSASEALVMSADPQTGNSPYIGRAFKQSGTFSSSSLSGNGVVYHSGPSSSVTGGSRTEIDLIGVSGSNFTFGGYQNDGGATVDPTTNSGSGTLSVASNGRVTLTCAACGHVPLIYLFSPNNGFFLSADGTASFGLLTGQTGGPFSASSLSGVYGIGTLSPEVMGVTDVSGALTFTPATTSITGTTDKNAQGTLAPDTAVSSTYSISSTGVGLQPSGCTLTGASANCKNLFVVISPTQAVMMKVDPTSISPGLSLLEQ